MAKLGKHALEQRLAVTQDRIGNMTVLLQHLDSDAADSDKIVKIRNFAEFWLESSQQHEQELKTQVGAY